MTPTVSTAVSTHTDRDSRAITIDVLDLQKPSAFIVAVSSVKSLSDL